MTRQSFGGSSADFVFSVTTGNLVKLSAATLTAWTTETGGSPVTDLVLNGSAVSTIPVGSDGQIPSFQGPDGVGTLWVSAGGGPRVILAAPGNPGAPGHDGSDGLPGVNAVPTDTAIGTYINTPGTATKTALSAAFAPLDDPLVYSLIFGGN